MSSTSDNVLCRPVVEKHWPSSQRTSEPRGCCYQLISGGVKRRTFRRGAPVLGLLSLSLYLSLFLLIQLHPQVVRGVDLAWLRRSVCHDMEVRTTEVSSLLMSVSIIWADYELTTALESQCGCIVFGVSRAIYNYKRPNTVRE